ncbi:uncharacterized protein AB9X84_000634 isoform 6-T6 [Acanthopagrus schlegelii]
MKNENSKGPLSPWKRVFRPKTTVGGITGQPHFILSCLRLSHRDLVSCHLQLFCSSSGGKMLRLSRRYKGSVSCPAALSSAAQSTAAELATTSKIPHRGSAPLAPRCNKGLPAQYHNKHRSEHVRDGVLNGSTQGEASEQTQSPDILKSKDKTKHLCSKTNTEEITDSERPSTAETLDDFLGGATTVPYLSTVETPSSESEAEEADDDLLDSWRATCREYKDVSQAISAPAVLCHSPLSLESPTAQSSTSAVSHEAPVNTDGCSLQFGFSSQLTQHHLHELQGSWRMSLRSLVSSTTTRFRQEDAAAQIGTSTTHTQQSATEACGPSTSRQLDNLSVDDTRYSQECPAAQEGATAAQNTADSSEQTACRRRERSLVRSSSEEDEDQCRICHGAESLETNPLISPCLCSGSLSFIHLECLKTWIQTKIESGSELCVVKRCEICMAGLTLDLDTFDLEDYCRRHRWRQMGLNRPIPNAEELAERSILRSVHIRVLLPALMSFYSPYPRVQVGRVHEALARRLRDLRSPSPEAPESPESPESQESRESQESQESRGTLDDT